MFNISIIADSKLVLQNRKERPNRSTNNRDMTEKARRLVIE